MSRPDDGEPGDRAVVEVDQALAEIQAALEEVSPASVAWGGAMIGTQNAVNVIGNRAADLGLPLWHRPSLAYEPEHAQTLALAAEGWSPSLER